MSGGFTDTECTKLIAAANRLTLTGYAPCANMGARALQRMQEGKYIWISYSVGAEIGNAWVYMENEPYDWVWADSQVYIRGDTLYESDWYIYSVIAHEEKHIFDVYGHDEVERSAPDYIDSFGYDCADRATF